MVDPSADADFPTRTLVQFSDSTISCDPGKLCEELKLVKHTNRINDTGHTKNETLVRFIIANA